MPGEYKSPPLRNINELFVVSDLSRKTLLYYVNRLLIALRGLSIFFPVSPRILIYAWGDSSSRYILSKRIFSNLFFSKAVFTLVMEASNAHRDYSRVDLSDLFEFLATSTIRKTVCIAIIDEVAKSLR